MSVVTDLRAENARLQGELDATLQRLLSTQQALMRAQQEVLALQRRQRQVRKLDPNAASAFDRPFR